MNVLEYINNNITYLDGGMGTLLQSRGLEGGVAPESFNITHKEVVRDIHKAYFDRGANIVNTNTFGANLLHMSEEELDNTVRAAIDNARWAMERSSSTAPKWIALDIGPTGRMLKPYGDLDFEEAVEIFAASVRLGVKYGADLIFIETMTDSYETKAAVLAAKENCSLPVFVANAYGEDGKLLTGADPSAMIAMLEGLGADAIGVNCSFGPDRLRGVVSEYLRYASVPVIVKPNAGLPRVVGGICEYSLSAEAFADVLKDLIKDGVRLAGGCCGTTPEYTEALVLAAKDIPPVKVEDKNITWVSSYTHAVKFDTTPILIGERINPTGKRRFKEALICGDMDYILKEGISQQDRGVHILDVNVGLPEIDERTMLPSAVRELQAVTDLPLQIDSSDPAAMEAALRVYNGCPMINSVSGKTESMRAIFPLAKKYGGTVVALTLDESGIPSDPEERVRIAEKIIDEAQKIGIPKKRLIFDTLAMTVSADTAAPKKTLEAQRIISRRIGVHTSLGVSNVSFGLPCRDDVNASFFTMALSEGLSAAIMNPYSDRMMKAYHSYLVLSGIDTGCREYIEYCSTHPDGDGVEVKIKTNDTVRRGPLSGELFLAISKGMKDSAAAITAQMLKSMAPLDIVERHIVPALNEVGVGYEEKTVYLPGLLMSAEAAGAAFEVIRSSVSVDKASDKCPVVIATVKGDIHDIGKNIVKLMLENYGFQITDLGKDVAPEAVVEAVLRLKAPIAVLSALMTTTVPSMARTVKLLHEKAPFCRVMVGGAVLNREYADSIDADMYAKDAMEAVRYCEKINTEVK